MIPVRLARRNSQATGIKIKTITGTVTESGLTATHQQTQPQERAGPLNEVSTKVIDLFFFEKDSAGNFPSITEASILEWDSTDYNVRSVRTLNELAGRQRVETERAR